VVVVVVIVVGAGLAASVVAGAELGRGWPAAGGDARPGEAHAEATSATRQSRPTRHVSVAGLGLAWFWLTTVFLHGTGSGLVAPGAGARKRAIPADTSSE
jgi:hypothetical protein